MIFLLKVNQKHINIMWQLFILMFLYYFCPLLGLLKLYSFSFNVQYNVISGNVYLASKSSYYKKKQVTFCPSSK